MCACVSLYVRVFPCVFPCVHVFPVHVCACVSVYVCFRVCVTVHECVCLCACVSVYVSACPCMCACVCVSMCVTTCPGVCMCPYVSVPVYVSMRECVRVSTVCTCVHTCPCECLCVHVSPGTLTVQLMHVHALRANGAPRFLCPSTRCLLRARRAHERGKRTQNPGWDCKKTPGDDFLAVEGVSQTKLDEHDTEARPMGWVTSARGPGGRRCRGEREDANFRPQA